MIPLTRKPSSVSRTGRTRPSSRRLENEGIHAFAGALQYLEAAREAGMKCAVISASANTESVLERSGLAPMIDRVVDGNLIRSGDLENKPAPDTIITACELLGVEASEAATFETTLVGLDASRTAGVAFTVAVDRTGRAETLRDHGAQNVVSDLVELSIRAGSRARVEPSVLRRSQIRQSLPVRKPGPRGARGLVLTRLRMHRAWHDQGPACVERKDLLAQARMRSAQVHRPWSLRRPLMTIVIGLDQHRAQITYDQLDTETGEVRGGRICPANRETVRVFLCRFAGRKVEAAVEATTGWRFLVEELRSAGAVVHLAEPAETSERRGRKRRAKTDRADARHLRELLQARKGAGVVDPACASARAAFEGAASAHARRAALGVAAADPGAALSPRGAAAAPAFDAREPRLARNAGAARGRSSPARSRVADDRAAAGRDRADRAGAAGVRAPPAGLPGADAPLRDRRADRGHDPGRARRRAPLRLLAPRRPLQRPRHHRARVRSTARGGAPLPAGPAGAALGPVRGRPGSAAAELSPTAPTTSKHASGSAATVPASRSLASCSNAPTTPSTSSARRRCSRRDRLDARPSPHIRRSLAACSLSSPAATRSRWPAQKD